MSKLISRVSIASVLITLLAMLGCSSGGGDAGVSVPLYSGNTAPAAITLADAEEMARRSTEGVNEAVNLTKTGDGLPFAVETGSASDALAQKVRDVAVRVLDGTTTLNLPGGLVLTHTDLNAETGGNDFCGGSVTVPDNIDQTTTLNFSMTFNSLCFDDGITALVMSGTLVFAETASNISITFTNFSVNINGEQETFSGVFSCDTTMSNCTISTDFVGSDGNVYRLANVDIIDTGNGYDLNANFFHHQHGEVSITTTQLITYGGCGVFPNGGVIQITGSGGSSMMVTFNSDCTFTIQGSDGGSSFGPTIVAWQ